MHLGGTGVTGGMQVRSSDCLTAGSVHLKGAAMCHSAPADRHQAAGPQVCATLGVLMQHTALGSHIDTYPCVLGEVFKVNPFACSAADYAPASCATSSAGGVCHGIHLEPPYSSFVT